MSPTFTEVACADTTRTRPRHEAIAMVADELDRLPRVDDRYRLWPWSLRALARRRGCSPGTVHQRRHALLAAGVFVTDDHGRTLVDIVRLEEARAAGGRPASCRHRRRVPGPPTIERSEDAHAAAEAEADVLAAIEALAAAVESRQDLAGMLAPIIGRLARLVGTARPPAVRDPAAARPRATPQPRESRAPSGPDQAADPVRYPSAAETTPRDEARDRASSKKERKTQDLPSSRAMDSDLPGLSLSSDDEARAQQGARERRADARSTARLLELLGPLDPARHVTYLDGVQAALTGYDDVQVTQAVTRIARLGHAATNPVGLLVDRANAGDPLYFPPPPPQARDDGPAVEPPAELSSWSTDPTGSDAADDDTDALPDLDADRTLAAALAARAALDAARQPVTSEQLAVRQAELAAAGAPSSRGTGRGKPEDEEQAA